MSASFNTIVVIGGTSGIGEAFAKRFHSMGKKVIITGRREQRLATLTSQHTGMESYKMDNTDLAAIPGHVDALFAKYPDIDTVWVNSGLQSTSSIKDLSSTTDEAVINEITTNITAPYLISRHVIPRLLARGTETSFMITSSGLAFVPVPMFPVYNSTKSAIHQYLVSLRQQLKDTSVNILELVPPYVATDLDAAHKDAVGGLKPMALEDFENDIFEVLEKNQAKDLKEITAGTGVNRVNAWRSSMGEILKNSGMGG